MGKENIPINKINKIQNIKGYLQRIGNSFMSLIVLDLIMPVDLVYIIFWRIYSDKISIRVFFMVKIQKILDYCIYS
jgi:hypothetical protein